MFLVTKMPLNDYRKNILDLYYNKNLQNRNTTIILIFTYIIAISIAFLTNQLIITDIFDVYFSIVISGAVIITGLLLLNKFNYHLKKIPEEIKNISKINPLT